MRTYLFVTWKDLELRLMILADMIRFREQKPHLIVAIARGGLTIAHILSDLLELPVASFTVSSYKDLKRTDDLNMTYRVGGRLKQKRVLLVDDVSDTGKTFVRAIKYLKQCGAIEVIPVALFTKPESEFRPAHSVTRTDAWVIFPWDQFETMKALHKEWMKEEILSPEELRVRFSKLGFSQNHITRFLSVNLVGDVFLLSLPSSSG